MCEADPAAGETGESTQVTRNQINIGARVVAGIVALFLVSAAAHAATLVSDFSQNSASVSDSNPADLPPGSTNLGPLPLAGTVFDQGFALADATSAGTATADWGVACTGGGGNGCVRLSTDSASVSADFSLQFNQSTFLDVDMTDGGAADRLFIQIENLTTDVTINLQAFDSFFNFATATANVTASASPQLVEVAFADFFNPGGLLSFSAVNNLTLDITHVGGAILGADIEKIAVGAQAQVPAPAGAALLITHRWFTGPMPSPSSTKIASSPNAATASGSAS